MKKHTTATPHKHSLQVKDLGIDTYRENIIFMKSDCHICISEGFTALTRVIVHHNKQEIIATLNVVNSDIIDTAEAGLSAEAMLRLGVRDGDEVYVSHMQPIASLSKVRAKMYRKELDEASYVEIVNDIAAGRYSNIEIAAFVTACAGDNLTVNEMIGLTRAMIATGRVIPWEKGMIMDKHCVGGLPGNRTTPIVVSIVAAAGLSIPKTSSRAITSPAGTADTMETMTTVNLSIEKIQEVVRKEGGCFAWGGAVRLSPVDDLLITVERALEIDSEGQMVASVLSKKAAAGSTHILIDIPVGPTAKVRTHDEALRLQYYFKAVSEAIGFHTEVVLTDGTQPVGRGIGPALEAMDVLEVLRNTAAAPADLKERSIALAAQVLKISGKYPEGMEGSMAASLLENGDAYRKFLAICEAQGGFREPVLADCRFDVLSEQEGSVRSIDSRKLARIAKLAGAPRSPSAGVRFFAKLGKKVKPGELLFSIYAESPGILDYVKEYVSTLNDLIVIKR